MEPQVSSPNKILTIFLVILIIITVGFAGLILLSINQKKTLPKTTLQISPPVGEKAVTTVTPTITPTVQSEDPNSIDVGSVETDLKDIGADVKSLQ